MGNLLKEIFYALGESIVGLIVGLYFLFVLDNIMGELIIIIGFLITLSRYIICRSFVVEFETLLNFYRLKDEIQQKHDIEFLNKADEIQKKFFNEMQKLSQGEIKYDSIGPYLEAAKRHVKNTKKCMKATSLVDPREWLEGGQLFDYFQEQVKALKKKKKLEIFRIFFLDIF